MEGLLDSQLGMDALSPEHQDLDPVRSRVAEVARQRAPSPELTGIVVGDALQLYDEDVRANSTLIRYALQRLIAEGKLRRESPDER